MNNQLLYKNDNRHAETMATQYEAQGQNEMAARFYRLAGDSAFANYANDEAIRHYSQALLLTTAAKTEPRYALMFSLERVYAHSNQPTARGHNLTSLAALADAINDDQKRADVAVRLALFKLDSGEHEDVISISRLALRIAQMAEATAAEVALNLVWGRALVRLAAYASAKGKFQDALSLAQKHAFTAQEAESCRYLGVANEEMGHYSEAKSLYNQALTLYKRLNDQRGQCDLLNNLGKVAYDQGEYTAALNYWNSAKPNYLEMDDKSGLTRSLINQSAMCLDLGDYRQAKIYSQEALALSQEIELRFGECLALINMALAEYYQGQLPAALDYCEQAFTLASTMGSKRLEGYAHQTMGKILVAQQQFESASEQYWHALAIWHELEQPSLIIEAEGGLVEAALCQGDVRPAQVHVESIVKAIDSGQSFDGAESPFRLYWLSYQALKHMNDFRAPAILAKGQQLLQERANKITDEAAKRMFLTQVESHRLLMAEVRRCEALPGNKI